MRTLVEPEGPRPANARERQAVILEERQGLAFLIYREPGYGLRFVSLADGQQLAIGRNPAAGLCIGWDGEVSGLRALFDKFDVAGLPQNKKRLALAGRALQSGLVGRRDG